MSYSLIEISNWIDKTEKAVLSLGLDIYPQEFEFYKSKDSFLSIVSQNAFPESFFHWSFGREFENYKFLDENNMQGIKEVVRNSNPCRAYMWGYNSLPFQILVSAHVYAHNNFFKTNKYLRLALLDEPKLKLISVNAEIIKKLKEELGEEVDKVLDAARYIAFHKDIGQFGGKSSVFKEDILRYILTQGDLEPWKRKVMEVVIQWSDHLYPQFITKLINEGWATYWQWKIIERLKEEFNLPRDIYEECRRYHSHFITLPPIELKEFLKNPDPYWLGYNIWNETAKIFADLTYFAANFNNYDFVHKLLDDSLACQILALLQPGDLIKNDKDRSEKPADFSSSKLIAFMESYWGPRSLPRIGVAEGSKDLKLVHLSGESGNQSLLDEKKAGLTLKAMKYLWSRGEIILETENAAGGSLILRSGE
ncbi:MAG: SpoVR family protein [Patescibacteria group bacterium]|nr:SpoVR family protein [Patescibacteria group bacterium]